MTRIFSYLFLLALPFLAAAETWEIGASGGYGAYRNVNVTAAGLSGKAGFASGYSFGALLGNQMNRWMGGEVRYTYSANNLQVSSGSTKATATAMSHAIHYDVLVHASSKESPVRPFVAFGAGMKFYRGTGAEPAFQPLSNLVVLTHANEAQPLVSAGGGVKVSVSRRMLFRLDFRDYVTPVPTTLLATPNTRKIGGWMHDFVFLVGVSGTF
jgi:hypothetical protein